MIERCQSAGLKQLEFSVDTGFFILTVWRKHAGMDLEPGRHQVGTKLALSRHQADILRKCLNENGITELMKIAGRTDRTKFRNQVLNPLLRDGLLEMTIPQKPSSPLQKYRITPKGRALIMKPAKDGTGTHEK